MRASIAFIIHGPPWNDAAAVASLGIFCFRWPLPAASGQVRRGPVLLEKWDIEIVVILTSSYVTLSSVSFPIATGF